MRLFMCEYLHRADLCADLCTNRMCGSDLCAHIRIMSHIGLRMCRILGVLPTCMHRFMCGYSHYVAYWAENVPLIGCAAHTDLCADIRIMSHSWTDSFVVCAFLSLSLALLSLSLSAGTCIYLCNIMQYEPHN